MLWGTKVEKRTYRCNQNAFAVHSERWADVHRLKSRTGFENPKVVALEWRLVRNWYSPVPLCSFSEIFFLCWLGCHYFLHCSSLKSFRGTAESRSKTSRCSWKCILKITLSCMMQWKCKQWMKHQFGSLRALFSLLPLLTTQDVTSVKFFSPISLLLPVW